MFGRHRTLVPGTLSFSPDGTRLAYAASNGKNQFYVVDGVRGNDFDTILGNFAQWPTSGTDELTYFGLSGALLYKSWTRIVPD